MCWMRALAAARSCPSSRVRRLCLGCWPLRCTRRLLRHCSFAMVLSRFCLVPTSGPFPVSGRSRVVLFTVCELGLPLHRASKTAMAGPHGAYRDLGYQCGIIRASHFLSGIFFFLECKPAAAVCLHGLTEGLPDVVRARRMCRRKVQLSVSGQQFGSLLLNKCQRFLF